MAGYVRVSVSRRCGRCASRLGRAELVRAVELPNSASLCGRTIAQRNIAHGRKGAGSRPRWWAHFTLATRIAREREPTSGLRLEMTVSPDEDKAGVQFLVSELVHEVIALVGGPPTTPDWTVVDAESGLCEEGALEWSGLDLPIPDQTALDDETFARAVATAGALAAMDDGAGQTVQGPPERVHRRTHRGRMRGHRRAHRGGRGDR